MYLSCHTCTFKMFNTKMQQPFEVQGDLKVNKTNKSHDNLNADDMFEGC